MLNDIGTLKFKNSVLKGYYIFDWNEENFFESCSQKNNNTYLICIHTERCSSNLLKEFLKWEVLCKSTGKWSQKSIKRCSVKLLRYVLKKILKSIWKRAESFCKLLGNLWHKYWEVFCKNTARSKQKYWNVFSKIAEGS